MLIHDATMAALDAACEMIQKSLGVGDGGFAGMYWSGEREEALKAMIRDYYEAERRNAQEA